MKLQEKFIKDLALNGARIDNRKPEEYRKIVIEKNPVEKAEGSARVKFGNTEILAGIKMEIGEPFPDKPAEGILITSAEFSPIAAADFERGPPNEHSVELARVVDRGIRESKAIDTGKLLIEEGKVWKVFIDIHVMNHDGNLIDASGLAALVALMNTKMPGYEDGKVVYGKKERSLPMQFKPVPVTLYKIGEKLFVDTVIDEENICGARITVSTKDDGNICALQKGGESPLSAEEIEAAVSIAGKKAQELRKLL